MIANRMNNILISKERAIGKVRHQSSRNLLIFSQSVGIGEVSGNYVGGVDISVVDVGDVGDIDVYGRIS